MRDAERGRWSHAWLFRRDKFQLYKMSVGKRGWLANGVSAAVYLAFALVPIQGHGQERHVGRAWRVELHRLDAVPRRIKFLSKIRGRGLRKLRVETQTDKVYHFTTCGSRRCMKVGRRATARDRVPKGALHDGAVVSSKAFRLKAWLAAPTRRYAHGALGDEFEAAVLKVRMLGDETHELRLPQDSVFEDLTPRLTDLDSDGKTEFVLVRSYLSKGAALSVIGLAGTGLRILAETPPIGVRNRWLNPAGIADFDGDGHTEIALIKTPHIGGRLEFWRYRNRSLKRIVELTGFSNHVFGSRVQKMSAAGDFDGDGLPDLAVPDQERRSIRIISLAKGRVAEPARIKLPAPVVTEIHAVKLADNPRPALVLGLANRQVAVLYISR